METKFYTPIIPTHCFYRCFGDFDWSVGKIKLFLHFDKNPCVGIFDNCLDFKVLDCVDTVKPAVAVTSIKRDPPLSGHFRVPPNDFECKYTSIKHAPVQRGQRSAKFAPKC